MEFIKSQQLNIMLVLTGVCGLLTFFALFTKAMPPRRRRAIFLVELTATLLLVSDRVAYLYRGEPGAVAFVAVRAGNFALFLLTLLVLFSFNLYLTDLFTNEGSLKRVPRRLQAAQVQALAGIALLVASQPADFYYYFDDMNRYHRGGGYAVSLLAPLSVLVLQMSVIIQHYGRLSRHIRIPTLLFTLLPIAAAGAQVFAYGLSLINMTIVGDAVLLYLFALLDLNATVERSKRREIELLKDEQRNINLMLMQTAESLASAIDAKDSYTHGHSTRVAEYSRRIAARAGKPTKDCTEVYIAALLHDVGKIGVPNAIINKDGSLSDDEYWSMKMHPVIGRQILENISQAPYISVGAMSHHERFDGRGYPEGLKGMEIPEIARIIAVADSYDAMTSKRSYRAPLPQPVVRAEIARGSGTQFDPEFASIMLEMIDEDKGYRMQDGGR